MRRLLDPDPRAQVPAVDTGEGFTEVALRDLLESREPRPREQLAICLQSEHLEWVRPEKPEQVERTHENSDQDEQHQSRRDTEERGVDGPSHGDDEAPAGPLREAYVARERLTKLDPCMQRAQPDDDVENQPDESSKNHEPLLVEKERHRQPGNEDERSAHQEHVGSPEGGAVPPSVQGAHTRESLEELPVDRVAPDDVFAVDRADRHQRQEQEHPCGHRHEVGEHVAGDAQQQVEAEEGLDGFGGRNEPDPPEERHRASERE